MVSVLEQWSSNFNLMDGYSNHETTVTEVQEAAGVKRMILFGADSRGENTQHTRYIYNRKSKRIRLVCSGLAGDRLL